jgi:hypothetical protein
MLAVAAASIGADVMAPLEGAGGSDWLGGSGRRRAAAVGHYRPRPSTAGLDRQRWPATPISSLGRCWCDVVKVAVSRGWLVRVVGTVVVLSAAPSLFRWRCCGGDGERPAAIGHVRAACMVRNRAKAFTAAFVGGA